MTMLPLQLMLIHFIFPSPSMVLFDTFVSILSHNLAEPAYEADVAQLEYKVMAKEHGLTIIVKGFNHKLPVSDPNFFIIYFHSSNHKYLKNYHHQDNLTRLKG